MKNIIIVLVLFFGTSFAFAQKYAYIDSDYILKNMPEYADAKEKLDKMADRWTKEIEERYAVLKMKKEAFAREEVLLPAEERLIRQEEITKMEAEAIQMQSLRFGVTGDYFNKRKELIKPIQDRIYESMEKIAQKRNFQFVFDKANQSNLVYADTKSDISNEVLKDMGIIVK
jgi:outer membrane protein